MKTLTVSAVLSVGPCTYTEYLSLSKEELISKCLSWERNNHQIERLTFYSEKETVSVRSYSELYGLLSPHDEFVKVPMTRCPTR